MTEQFAECFHIKSEFDANRGVGVAEQMKIYSP